MALLSCAADTGPPADRLAEPDAVPTSLFPESWDLLERTEAVEAAAGMVVSGHPLASSAGARILERGGNAIDAAVAVGFALAVVMPEAGNIGGGGFLVYRSAEGEASALDFRETAPAAAARDMFAENQGEPTDASLLGHLASGVPGTVAGLWEMHRRLGSAPWEELLTPAVELARGHVVDEVRSEVLAGAADRLRLFEASAAVFLPGGDPPGPGEQWAQPELARTLERIAGNGAEEFYRGRTARLLTEEMERGGGLISEEDLAGYRPVWRDPVRFEYRNHVVWSMPPPSSGGPTLALLFNVLAGYDILPRFGSVPLVHLEAEAMRWAFALRNRHLGDPAFWPNPVDRFTSEDLAAQIRARIPAQRAGSVRLDEEGWPESNATTHYSVVDGAGNCVSLTTTLNYRFGSGVTVAGAGFLLNNEMDDFAAKPGVPNEYGLVQGEANAVAPGKRMLSSMAPSIVEDGQGRVRMILGGRGGPRIITAVFQVVSNLLDHGMTPEEALAAPRIHHQGRPDVLVYEPGGLREDVKEKLRRMGHELEPGYPVEPRTTGAPGVQAIVRRDDVWVGVSDPRKGGGAAGISRSELPAAAVE